MALFSVDLFLYLNDASWDANMSEIVAHVTWAASSHSGCFDEAKAYLSAYFRHRIGPGR